MWPTANIADPRMTWSAANIKNDLEINFFLSLTRFPDMHQDIRAILAGYIGEHTYLRFAHIYADLPATYYRETIFMEINDCNLHIPDSYENVLSAISAGTDTNRVLYCGNRGITRNGFKYLRNRLHGYMDIYNNDEFNCKIGMNRGRLLYQTHKECIVYNDVYYMGNGNPYIGQISDDDNIRVLYNRIGHIVYKNNELWEISTKDGNYTYEYAISCNYRRVKCRIGDIKYNIYKSDYETYCEIHNIADKYSKPEYKFHLDGILNLRCDESYIGKLHLHYNDGISPLFDIDSLTLYRPCGRLL